MTTGGKVTLVNWGLGKGLSSVWVRLVRRGCEISLGSNQFLSNSLLQSIYLRSSLLISEFTDLWEASRNTNLHIWKFLSDFYKPLEEFVLYEHELMLNVLCLVRLNPKLMVIMNNAGQLNHQGLDHHLDPEPGSHHPKTHLMFTQITTNMAVLSNHLFVV